MKPNMFCMSCIVPMIEPHTVICSASIGSSGSELDQRSGHTTRGTLHQEGLSWSQVGFSEERSIGRQPRCAHHRSVQSRYSRRPRNRVAARNCDEVGESSLDALAEDVPVWIERLITAPI